MTYYADPAQLADAWRRMTDAANESGETPVFALGLGTFYRSGTLNLLALGRLARLNLGLQHPVVVAGGESWLWLCAMLIWRPSAGEKRFSAGAGTISEGEQGQTDVFDNAGRRVLYAGADSALYAAALNLAEQPSARGAAPAGLDWSRTLSSSPGVEGADIEVLPAVVAHESVPELSFPPPDTWIQRCERWASIALALALLLAALFG